MTILSIFIRCEMRKITEFVSATLQVIDYYAIVSHIYGSAW